ncbi:hypothetical protein GN958_ATG05601 [Phytophthora infestans]|uniref:Uncharacterized protein n=1 Tax=Phytophthora infestans TaxID=4787 RepID=A0A8S9UX17_PHYIN|nr:hypothetical protein GN958_ATG05601 [Phytophthora infestans]
MVFLPFLGLAVPSEVVTKKGHFPVLKYLQVGAGREFKHETKQVKLVEDVWVDSVPVMPPG